MLAKNRRGVAIFLHTWRTRHWEEGGPVEQVMQHAVLWGSSWSFPNDELGVLVEFSLTLGWS